MNSLKRFDGYLMVDHRESPGVPEAGLPAHTLFETATITCTHCGGNWRKNPLRTRPRQYCAKCDHYICDKPMCVLMASGVLPHKPLRQLFDELSELILKGDYENAVQRQQQHGPTAGACSTGGRGEQGQRPD